MLILVQLFTSWLPAILALCAQQEMTQAQAHSLKTAFSTGRYTDPTHTTFPTLYTKQFVLRFLQQPSNLQQKSQKTQLQEKKPNNK